MTITEAIPTEEDVMKASTSEIIAMLRKAHRLIHDLHEMTREGEISRLSHVGPSLTLKRAVRDMDREIRIVLLELPDCQP